MGFEADKTQDSLQREFESLGTEKARLEAAVNQWVGRAASLHTVSAGTDYKADVLAMRDDLILSLRITLGV